MPGAGFKWREEVLCVSWLQMMMNLRDNFVRHAVKFDGTGINIEEAELEVAAA